MIRNGQARSFLRAGAVSILLAGCASPAASGPTAVATDNPSPTTTPIAAPTPTLAPTPTPPPTFPPDPDPSHMPAGFIESFGQLTEEVGGHGGSPAVMLPASVAIDYWVSGTCDFRIDVIKTTSSDLTPVATFAMRLLGSTESGTWPVSVKAGEYYVTPHDAPGCRFSVTVRAGP
jgi:hypothetical protein